MSQFKDIISIGFDKNGEPDFRITVAHLDGVSIEKMNALRAMSVLALVEAEEWWRRFREHLLENQACAANGQEPRV